MRNDNSDTRPQMFLGQMIPQLPNHCAPWNSCVLTDSFPVMNPL